MPVTVAFASSRHARAAMRSPNSGSLSTSAQRPAVADDVESLAPCAIVIDALAAVPAAAESVA